MTFFLTWLSRFKGNNSALGDLAKDLLNDPDLPIITKNSKKQVYHYLQNKNFVISQEFCKAFDEWYYEEYYVKRFKTISNISKDKRDLWK